MSKKNQKNGKSLEEMKQEALRRQENLASDIHELLDRVHPVNAAQRFKNETTNAVKARPIPVVGALVGTLSIIAGVLVLASRGNKK